MKRIQKVNTKLNWNLDNWKEENFDKNPQGKNEPNTHLMPGEIITLSWYPTIIEKQVRVTMQGNYLRVFLFDVFC